MIKKSTFNNCQICQSRDDQAQVVPKIILIVSESLKGSKNLCPEGGLKVLNFWWSILESRSKHEEIFSTKQEFLNLDHFPTVKLRNLSDASQLTY